MHSCYLLWILYSHTHADLPSRLLFYQRNIQQKMLKGQGKYGKDQESNEHILSDNLTTNNLRILLDLLGSNIRGFLLVPWHLCSHMRPLRETMFSICRLNTVSIKSLCMEVRVLCLAVTKQQGLL